LYDNNFTNKDSYPLDSTNITVKGILANNIFECNEILLSEIILSGLLDDLDFKYLGAVLAIFADSKPVHKETESGYNSLTKQDLPEIFDLIEKKCSDFSYREQELGIISKSKWNINIFTLDAVYDWLDGQEFGTVISNYDLFEGSFIKDLFKIYNISGELETCANICNKNSISVECIKIRQNIIRDIVNMESLYIKN
jgi:antiviral helicase SKI2